MGLRAKVDGTHGSIVCNGVMLGEVVDSVAFFFVPIVLDLAFGIAILEPKIMHVHGFGAVLLDDFLGAGMSLLVWTIS